MNNQNNWIQFQHGSTQYGTPGTTNYVNTPTAQSGYVTTPNYQTTTQRAATGYDQSQYPSQTYATQYEYGYGRPAQSYDTTKTYYQQASASYVAPAYDSSQASKAPVTTYAQPARTTIQQKPTQYSSAYASQATTNVSKQQNIAANTQQQPVATTTQQQTYSSYDTALYSAATVYMAQQNNKAANSNQQQAGWPKKGNNFKQRKNITPKPQQIHYCDVCKISCAGPQTYREHLEGQKHKKREALQKAQQDTTSTGGQQPSSTQRGSNLRCELCDVTCTGNDAYSAHVRGSKHQKVVKLHTKLGKPIPSTEPTPVNKDKEGADDDVVNEDIKPVGEEYIEEMKDPEGKVVTFNCKLCDCKFNDPNAKEMHTKGRRHRLQYKKKVQPDLVVDVKPTLRQRKLAEREKQRMQAQEEIWNRRNRMGDGDMDEEERIYWEERRRFEEEMGPGSGDWNRGGNFPRGRPLMGFPPMFNMMNGRRIETQDDRHVIARHAEIYPKEEELQSIQKIVSHTERALKLVSDAMTVQETSKDEKMDVQNDTEKTEAKANVTEKSAENKEGSQNQMITFQKDTEGTVRLLKGVMRVGLLAKGLLLQGDSNVQLVVLCAEKPTSAVLKRVVQELPIQLKKIADEPKYTVTMAPVEGAVLISDGAITVKVSLTSPLLRESADSTTNTESVSNSEDLLPREPSLAALRALRQSKWFQARATGLQSCVMIMRILRDLCQRNPTFTPLNQWAMELLTEKVIASAGVPLSPGDCLRRIMECLASGFIICGPGLMDPCEKEPVDALSGMSKQQREDITQQAQQFLRFIAFRQIHKVLGMDPLPVQKYQGNRPWKFNTSRKRRRSGTEASEGDGQKIVKKDGENNVAEAAAEKMN